MRGKFNACAQIRIDRTKKKMKDGIYMEKPLLRPSVCGIMPCMTGSALRLSSYRVILFSD